MGSLFSKSGSKVSPMPDPRQTASAPATLGVLEGTTPHSQLQSRLSDPGSPAVVMEAGKALADLPVSKTQDQPQQVSKAEITVTAPPTPEAPSTASLSPAIRGPKKIDVIGNQSDGMKLAADLPAAAAIPEEAMQWAQVFGDSIIRYYHSADWKEREQSLSSIQRSLSSPKFLAGKDSKAVFVATTEMLARTLKDKVAPIFHASLDLVSTLLASFCPLLAKDALRQGMEPLMPILVHRCGNLNTRIHEASLQTLVSVASFPGLGCGYVAPFAMAEMPKRGRDASQAAQMYGRQDLMSSLLSTYRSMSELSVQEVLKFAKLGLDMPDDKVRQSAVKVVVEVYKLQRSMGKILNLEQQLGMLKPALMQMLQKRCEEGDSNAGAEEAGTTNGGDSRKLPALGNGIKVYGKALPPLSSPQSGLSPLKKPVEPFSSSSSPSSPSAAGRSPSVPRRERTRMGEEAGSTPNTPSQRSKPSLQSPSSRHQDDLGVPRYTDMVGSPSGRTKKQQPAGNSTVFDATEEQLIQYMMDEQRPV